MKRLFTLAIFIVLAGQLNAQDSNGRYTFVFLNTNPDRSDLPKAQVDSLQAGHMANINRLVKEKKMIAAGPFYTGGGIFLFDTNLAETQAVLDSDPAIAAGRFKLEVYPFNLVTGDICTLWDKNEEDVEMTTYFFVRYQVNQEHEDKDDADGNRMIYKFLSEIGESNGEEIDILGALDFSGNNGLVVIYKSSNEEGKEEVFKSMNLVEDGLLLPSYSKIYFPKGVFCEK